MDRALKEEYEEIKEAIKQKRLEILAIGLGQSMDVIIRTIAEVFEIEEEKVPGKLLYLLGIFGGGCMAKELFEVEKHVKQKPK
jgi:hypothetical protein